MDLTNDILLNKDFALYLNSVHTVITLTSTVFALSLSTVSLYFAAFKLRLNPILKFILVVMTLFNVIGTTIQLIGEIILLHQESIPSTFICRCLAFPAASIIFGNFLTGSLISMLRLYMSKLAASAKVANIKMILPMIIFAITVNYSINLLLVVFLDWNDSSNMISKCLLLDLDATFIPIRTICYWFVLAIVGWGATSDYEMYLFVKQRNAANASGTQLVPWRSNQDSLPEALDIPIKATMISAMGFFFLLSILIFIANDLFYGIVSSHVMIISLTTFCSTTLPIILMFFAVKKQNKIHNAQPPTGLQMHAIDFDDEIIVENQLTPGTEQDCQPVELNTLNENIEIQESAKNIMHREVSIEIHI